MIGERAFDPLLAELDRWHSHGLRAGLWWRDDDAGPLGSALTTLIELAERHQIVCGVAVVPAWLEPATGEALAQSRHVAVLQHGYAHTDHVLGGVGGAAELGPERSVETALTDLVAGRSILEQQLSERFVPVVAPPWNRINPALFNGLVARGYRGITTEGPRSTEWAAPGLRQINIHADLISWRGGVRFKGAVKSVACLTDHLIARRVGAVDDGEVTGLITHHRDMCSACWEFVDSLFKVTRAHPAAAWQDPWRLWP